MFVETLNIWLLISPSVSMHCFILKETQIHFKHMCSVTL